jgi:hypothetical protein
MKEIITDAQYKELLAVLDRTSPISLTLAEHKSLLECLVTELIRLDQHAKLGRTEGKQVPEHACQSQINLAAVLEKVRRSASNLTT